MNFRSIQARTIAKPRNVICDFISRQREESRKTLTRVGKNLKFHLIMKRIFILFGALILTSCANSRFIQTGFNSQALPPLSKDAPVSVITSIPKNATKVVELGMCKGTAPGGGIISDRTHKAIEQLKKCARENGGNAIILGGNSEGGLYTDMGYSQQVAKAQGMVYYIEVSE